MTFWELLPILVVLLAVAIGVSAWLGRKRRSVWQRFARRHRLQYGEPRPGLPQVTGQIDGRPVRLTVAGQGSDTGELGVQEVRLSVGVARGVPAGVEISPRGLVAAAAEMMEGESVRTGDDEFDRRAVVRGEPDQVRAWLDDSRRRALERLFAVKPSGTSGMQGANVYIQSREMVASPDELDRWLDELMRTARELDSPG
jgi:hypothetical protein